LIEPVAQTLLQAHAPQDVGLIDVVNPACCAGWGAQVVCATGSIIRLTGTWCLWPLDVRLARSTWSSGPDKTVPSRRRAGVSGLSVPLIIVWVLHRVPLLVKVVATVVYVAVGIWAGVTSGRMAEGERTSHRA